MTKDWDNPRPLKSEKETPPIVQELFKLLPPLGQPFSDVERKRFIAAAEAIFAVVYPMPVIVLKPGERFEPFPCLKDPDGQERGAI